MGLFGGGSSSGGGGKSKTTYDYYAPGTQQNPGWAGLVSPLKKSETTKVSALGGGGGGGGGIGSMLGSLGGAALGQILIPIPGVGAAIGAGIGGQLGNAATGGEFNWGDAAMNSALGLVTGGMGSSAGGATGAAGGLKSLFGATGTAAASIPPSVNIAQMDAALGGGGIKGALTSAFTGNSIYPKGEPAAPTYLQGLKNRASGMWNGGQYAPNWNGTMDYAMPSLLGSGARTGY